MADDDIPVGDDDDDVPDELPKSLTNYITPEGMARL